MKATRFLTATIALLLSQVGVAAPPDKDIAAGGSFHASCTAFANTSFTSGSCSALELLETDQAVIDAVSINCHQFGNSDASDYRPIITAQLKFPGAGSGDTAEINLPLNVKGGKITAGNYDVWTTGDINGPYYAEGTPYSNSSIGLYFVRQYGALAGSNISCTLQVSGRLL